MPPLAAPRQPNRPPALAAPRKQNGMTLVELVITIVIIGIAAAALFSAMASITARSADPMLRQQSLMIAESYLEATLSLPYGQLSSAAQAPTPPQDVNKNPIGELAGYSVQVVVDSAANLNGVNATRVDVTVLDPQAQSLQVSGWRTCYGEYDAAGNDLCP
jgi:MSHA pilin protein MshD